MSQFCLYTFHGLDLLILKINHDIHSGKEEVLFDTGNSMPKNVYDVGVYLAREKKTGSTIHVFDTRQS